MTGLWLVVGVLLAATAFGLWRRRTSGRITDRPREAVVEMAGPDEPPVGIEADDTASASPLLAAALVGRRGEHATVVQFSSAFCQPCRATRRILEEVTVLVPGVAHVEIDAEDNLELVREMNVRRTPTVLFLDASGTVRKHASGLPRKADVIAALGDLIPPRTDPDFEI